MTRNAEAADRPFTMSVPAAGKKYLGLSRTGSYAAAARGDLPTMKIGRKVVVLVRPLERKLEGRE
jgi:hypothetical protein